LCGGLSTIKAFQNASDPEIQRIIDIKNDKSYLTRYIESFNHMTTYYRSIGENEQADFMMLSWNVFTTFQQNSEVMLNSFAEVNTYLLSTPDIARKISLLHDRKKLTPEQKKYIHQYREYKQIQEISKFFEGYNITRKVIVTSTSIYIFRSLATLENMQKYTLKDVVESIFRKLGEPLGVYPLKIDDIYLKAVFRNVPIFAYPSKNDRFPYIDINQVASNLEEKINSKIESGKIHESNKLQKYFESVITPLKQRLTV
jgi:hypothetical protein